MCETDDGPVVNDHSDAGYDAQIAAKLTELDGEVHPMVAALGDRLDRFRSYGHRLARAAARVAAGEKDWFTKPTIDSYHTVWFELHEDLLATLGIERGKETS
jgi:hypothetical protein